MIFFYLFKKNNNYYFSRIPPDEWELHFFIAKFYLDKDNNLVRL
uniref:Uncharacterized protein n=1 Tax=Megaviridae environmental sample TaxID=1737588 RepID=A0A5J6VKN6_9VIRU|nr:MAG: hypothetical protein [Megaviridae environmental sample]